MQKRDQILLFFTDVKLQIHLFNSPIIIEYLLMKCTDHYL